jgi:hypothetical protein
MHALAGDSIPLGDLGHRYPGRGLEWPVDVGDIQPDVPDIIEQDGKTVWVMPEITIDGRPSDISLPSAAGTAFTSPESAALSALSEIDTVSTDGNIEYAGKAYENPDGSYSFTSAAPGTSGTSNPAASPVPAGATVVGSYHSHAGEFNASDEFFSEQDKDQARNRHQFSYLVTPRGQRFQYTPVNMLPPSAQESYPDGRVTRLR